MGEIQLFLVRVWHERHQFRAAVRGAGAGEPRLFSAPEDVGEFLRRAAVPPGPAAPCVDASDLRATPTIASSAKPGRPQ